jgi:hypothetical protein
MSAFFPIHAGPEADPMTSHERRYRASADAIACDIGDGTALLDLASNQYYSLNKVGSFVWELLQQPRSASELREAMLARYDVSAARCDADIAALLSGFESAGLLRSTDEIAPSAGLEAPAVSAVPGGGAGDARRIEPDQVR